MSDIFLKRLRSQRPFSSGDPFLEEIQGFFAALGVFGEQDIGVGAVRGEVKRFFASLARSSGSGVPNA